MLTRVALVTLFLLELLEVFLALSAAMSKAKAQINFYRGLTKRVRFGYAELGVNLLAKTFFSSYNLLYIAAG